MADIPVATLPKDKAPCSALAAAHIQLQLVCIRSSVIPRRTLIRRSEPERSLPTQRLKTPPLALELSLVIPPEPATRLMEHSPCLTILATEQRWMSQVASCLAVLIRLMVIERYLATPPVPRIRRMAR